MNKRLLRRVAVALIAFLAFAQASMALAACSMDRGEMAQMMATDEDCCAVPEVQGWQPQLTNDCVAHCTADLQLWRLPVALVQQSSADVVLLVRHTAGRFPPPAQLEPAGARLIPPRILLHSFLI